jgi:hypothetical protein
VDRLGTYALMLRFRDLVTEPGGNIAEHRRIIRQRGYAWWGWWARQREKVPRSVFEQLFAAGAAPIEIILFDSGMMRLYRTLSRQAVIAPSHLGVNSPDFEATPEYYVRGRYPAWFRLEDDIVPIEPLVPRIVARPTTDPSFSDLGYEVQGLPVDLDVLRDEGPTLWVIMSTGGDNECRS